MARSLTVISPLFQSTTHCRYRVYTKFLLTYTAIYLSPTFTWARLIYCLTSVINWFVLFLKFAIFVVPFRLGLVEMTRNGVAGVCPIDVPSSYILPRACFSYSH